jgi:hypothetical protein
MIRQLKVSFTGSFQARLATDGDPTSASPTDPYGTYGAASSGWTYRYREPVFDRIIRLSSPVALRTALVDPWTSAVVKTVECDRGGGLVSVPGDPLAGQIVSLGKAKFDTSRGNGGVTREALVDLRFGLGSLLLADPASLPVLDGAKGGQGAWKAEYTFKKSMLIASSPLDPVRLKVLQEPNRIDSYASFFQIRCPTKPFQLTGVTFQNAVSGVLTQLESPAGTKYDWTIEMAFFRFDGDSLTGKMDGALVAQRKASP